MGGDLDGTVAWGALLAETVGRLTDGGIAAEDASREARWIVEEASGMERSELAAGLDELATERGVAHLDAMVARRLAGEPLQYVLGHWPFRTLDLMVDRRVLIPRPETEQVVEHALGEIDRRLAEGHAVVVDLGSGSGAIGLSIAAERARAGVAVWCVDASADAVAVTRANLAGLGMAGSTVRIVEGSWFEPLPDDLRGRLDLIVTNPPYVAADDPLPRDVADWEPTSALVPGPSGLEAIEHIVEQAASWLAPGGALVVEIGETQGDAVVELARRTGLVDARVEPDLAGRDRALVARRPA